ncbi:hypothetical protein [Candidatus Nitrososphaera sp. FF02]|uniref:hypothetical protein n=1 Tax=Candidatus Nitrososphaera sp. FF02 TaxID=3398226 RepID=UPI0039EA1029
MMLNILIKLQYGLIPFAEQEQFLGIKNRPIPMAAQDINLHLRLCITSSIQFKVENMIVNILARVGQVDTQRRYSKNVQLLLNKTNLPEQKEKEATLMILQHIRNSLHSNGIHNNKDFEATVEDYTFTFRKGQQVDCAGWGQIILACASIFDVLKEIVLSAPIKKIGEPIPTMYIEP